MINPLTRCPVRMSFTLNVLRGGINGMLRGLVLFVGLGWMVMREFVPGRKYGIV